MALVTTKRNVDVLPGQAAPTVFHCSQHDVGATIILGLVNAGGNFSIPSGVTAIIQGSCSNGAVFTPVTAAVSGSDITFNLSAEMTSIAGPTVCEAVLSKDTDILGTANFILDVEPSAMGSDTPPVFTDAAWLWMVDKMGSETVSALGDKTVIDAINEKADQSDVTALSNAKLDKNQGTANAGKYLKVGADGNVETADLDVTTDKTLSIADKAADAKAVGDELDDLKADLAFWDGKNLLSDLKKTNQTHKGITWAWNGNECAVSGTAEATANNDIYFSKTALPDGFIAGQTYALVYTSKKINLRVYSYNSSETLSGELINTKKDGSFTLPADAVGMIIRLNIPANSVVDETVRPMIPTNLTNAEIEKLINNNLLITLINKGTTFGDITSANNIDANTIYFVSSSGGTPIVTDVPYAPAWLVTMGNGSAFNSLAVQLLIPYFSINAMQMRVKRAGTWSDWEIYARDRTIYINGDSYENTYNITTSPTITVDSNGWLQPIDNSNTPEANATDMTGAIMSMLTKTGHCHLAPGMFYVTGNIDLPFRSTLEGCGQNTIVRLLTSQTSGYIAKATRFSTIKNIRFSGGSSAPDLTTADIGGRHGIAFIDDVSTGEVLPYVRPCIIDNCWFENFDGAGIYLNDSGGGVNQGVIASNCYIEFCKVGIDLWYYSEYHKFSNILTYHCYYGCINNGGNNMFVNCTFHGTIGFMIDNASGDRKNPGHGSAIGCTFNHIDQWNKPGTKGGGVAIKLSNILNGFVFDGCQIWYGTIEIADSVGVLISNTQIGGGTPQITVTGDYATFFANCLFHALPTISVNAKTKFNQCYYDVTGELITV